MVHDSLAVCPQPNLIFLLDHRLVEFCGVAISIRIDDIYRKRIIFVEVKK
jgi:hypothetical protein